MIQLAPSSPCIASDLEPLSMVIITHLLSAAIGGPPLQTAFRMFERNLNCTTPHLCLPLLPVPTFLSVANTPYNYYRNTTPLRRDLEWRNTNDLINDTTSYKIANHAHSTMQGCSSYSNMDRKLREWPGHTYIPLLKDTHSPRLEVHTDMTSTTSSWCNTTSQLGQNAVIN